MQRIQLKYRFRLYPKKEQEERILETFAADLQLLLTPDEWEGEDSKQAGASGSVAQAETGEA